MKSLSKYLNTKKVKKRTKMSKTYSIGLLRIHMT